MGKTRIVCGLIVWWLFCNDAAFSQGMRIWRDGEILEFTVSEVDSITFFMENPDSVKYEFVDLGLPSGLQWAKKNVGAGAPEQYGYYYAWGEKENKKSYECMNYEFYKAKNSTCSNLGNLSGTENDVAFKTWSDGWRMPTQAEMKELVENCTWTWMNYNGVEGMKVMGANGNFIFLPAAGYYRGAVLYADEEMGCYWTSNQRYHAIYHAWCLYFDLDGQYTGDCHYRRSDGHPIRPVRSPSDIPSQE